MSRVIKFRAWNRELQHMTREPFSFDGFDGKCFYDDTARPHDDPLWHLGDMEIMQFTGLLDKNGKEIYEGDILSIKVANEFGSAADDVGEVAFHPEAAQFIVRKEDLATNIGRDVEVIGNIYENPELLAV